MRVYVEDLYALDCCAAARSKAWLHRLPATPRRPVLITALPAAFERDAKPVRFGGVGLVLGHIGFLARSRLIRFATRLIRLEAPKRIKSA